MTDYCAEITVYPEAEIPFDYIKRELVYKYLGELFPPMIGDGKHHVMRFDYYIRDDFDYGRIRRVYRLQCSHNIADVQNITIAVYEDVATFGDKEYRRACRWCGAEFHPSPLRPGTCVSCGGPK